MSSPDDDNLLRDILDRLQNIEGVKTDAALLSTLKTTQSNLSAWKQRGTIPYSYLDDYCQRTDASMDYVLHGKGLSHRVAEESAAYNTSAPVYKIAGQVYDALTEAGEYLTPKQFERCVRLLHFGMLKSKESEISYAKVIEFLTISVRADDLGVSVDELDEALNEIEQAIIMGDEEEQRTAWRALGALRDRAVHNN